MRWSGRISVATMLGLGGLVATVVAGQEITLLFRDSASVNDTVIRLGDIARVSGASPVTCSALTAAIIGESAPAGYSRFVNSDEAVAALRRTSGPDVRLQPVNACRITVRTGARTYVIADFDTLIHQYLQRAIGWPAGDFAVRLIDSAKQFRCLDQPCEVSAGGLKDPLPRGTLHLRLTIRQGARNMSAPFNCVVTVTTPVVVSRQSIANQRTIGAADIAIERRDITNFRFAPLQDLEDALGKCANRTIPAGMVLHQSLLKKPPIVQKGDCITVCVSKGAIVASATVMARQSGALGERIIVENVNSHKILQVIIQAAGKAILPEKETL